MQKITVEPKGNNEKYSVANYETLSESPLSGKTYFWLGSSVTEGYGACDESMVDYIEKKYSATCIIETLCEMANKWDITAINLYDDESFNNISDEELALYMKDAIHPTRAGYSLWWLPKFEEVLLNL